MYKDSYSQRLKEIREKYGSTVKDTTSCLRSNQRTIFRNQNLLNCDKYDIARKEIEKANISKKYSENIDPLSTGYSSKYSTLVAKDKGAQQNYDSFLYTQSKEERLKEIEKIRQSVALSKKQALQEWSKEAERSKYKLMQAERYGGLRERTNTFIERNPQQIKHESSFKDISEKYTARNRAQSFSSAKIDSDIQLNKQLKRNYDYLGQDAKRMQNNDYGYDGYESRKLGAYRNNSVSKFDRQIEALGGGRNFACTSIELPTKRQNDNKDKETPSPIRGLMKLDSVQKTKRTQPFDIQDTYSKYNSTTYDLTNIDNIQQRIQRILAKK